MAESISRSLIELLKTDPRFLDDQGELDRSAVAGLGTRGQFPPDTSEVSLVWPYKDCVLEGGQTREEERREEIFFHEILARDAIDRLFEPKVLTNWKRYTVAGEQQALEVQRGENGVIKENLIIKGNNMLALHALGSQFCSRVKLIYIDPPYNANGGGFGYNDSLSHSTWLTFMKNRLEAARVLMRDDGVIFIHIGDQEMHYLKVMADGVFGRHNFVATIPRKTRSGKSDVPYKLSQDFDWMLIYTKGAARRDELFQRAIHRKYYRTPDFPDDEWRLADLTTQRTIHERPNSDFTLVNGKNGQEFPVNPNRSWAVTKDSVKRHVQENRIVFPGDYDFLKIRQPAMRVFKSEEMARKGPDFDKSYVSSDFLNRAMDELLKKMVNKKGTDEIIELFGRKAFSYPKNELLMQRIIEYTTKEGDIVLDYHLGSGTTAAVAHKMGRQYIGVEQMDYIETVPVERLKKVIAGEQGGISQSVNWEGGGSFTYCELMKYSEAYTDHIQDAESSEELVRLWQDIAENSFLNWYLNPGTPEDAVNDFVKIGRAEGGLGKQKRFLAELLDKNQIYVNLSQIDKDDLGVSAKVRAMNRSFYGEAVAETS